MQVALKIPTLVKLFLILVSDISGLPQGDREKVYINVCFMVQPLLSEHFDLSQTPNLIWLCT